MHSLIKSTTKFILLSGISLFLLNCSKDKANPLEDAQEVTATEVKTILEMDGISSATDRVVTGLFISQQFGKSSKSQNCYTTESTDTGFTVTFDNCSVERSENINGTITVVYTEGEETTSFITTYTDLTVGEYTLNGTRDFEVDSDFVGDSGSFTIVSDMDIELEDGSIIEEMGSKTFEVVIDSEEWQNSMVTVVGDWTVKADGDTYVVNITSPLEIAFFCQYASKGTMQLNKNGLEVEVDFGDGTCDDIATVTYPDGTVEEISLKD